MTTEQRIEKLENELICAKRRSGILLAGVCLLVVFLTLNWTGLGRLTPAYAQNTTSKEVRAKKFIVEDENGNTRAMLAVSKDISVLKLYDKNGKIRAGMVESGLFLNDENENCRGLLALLKDGPFLVLNDENGETRAGLCMSKDGSVMEFYGENGKIRAKLMEQGLFLLDENENMVWRTPISK